VTRRRSWPSRIASSGHSAARTSLSALSPDSIATATGLIARQRSSALVACQAGVTCRVDSLLLYRPRVECTHLISIQDDNLKERFTSGARVNEDNY
jgi:hypothetical protein